MPTAAVPEYLGKDFSEASPGLRFGMYLTVWGVNRTANSNLWTLDDIGVEERGRNREKREVKYNNKAHALDQAKNLNINDKTTMHALLKRQCDLFDHSVLPLDALRLDAVAISPFTTGLGNEHPLENGFAFLNPYGLPYLPGGGVKGTLRQAARELASDDWGDTQGWNEASITALFGREGKDGDTEHQRGALSFWDVIPQVAGDHLHVEIMTPHQSHYYQQKEQAGSTSPHDSGQPTPISYLTVPPGSRFVFHVQCDANFLGRTPSELVENEKWKKLMHAVFEHAFAWCGFGAKTAVGYGAMRGLSQTEINAAHAKAQASALHCSWVDDTINIIAHANNAIPDDVLRGKQLAEAWQALEDSNLKAQALADIRARWQKHNWWENPPGKSSRSAKQIYMSGN